MAKGEPFVAYEDIKAVCPECGRKGALSIRHYDKHRCKCGAVLWALRPTKDGPLKMFLKPVNEAE